MEQEHHDAVRDLAASDGLLATCDPAVALAFLMARSHKCPLYDLCR